MRFLKKYLPLITILGLAGIIWWFGFYKFLTLETLEAHQKSLENYVGQNHLFSLLFYSVLYILVVSLSLPGATVMTLMGGFFFGQWLGTIVVVLSATIGATVFFVSAKLASQDLLQKKAGAWAKRMQAGFQKNAFSYLLLLRLIPLFPFVGINLATALLQIPLRTFCLATLMGIIPGSFVYVSLGVALRTVSQKELDMSLLQDPSILFPLGGLVILAVLPLLYQRMKKS
ncbi:VTT domain-containing protein [Alphaproteobacteria bacterium]|nr:VTT domain-containing protein [Alphaproteobacteria bacterium]